MRLGCCISFMVLLLLMVFRYLLLLVQIRPANGQVMIDKVSRRRRPMWRGPSVIWVAKLGMYMAAVLAEPIAIVRVLEIGKVYR